MPGPSELLLIVAAVVSLVLSTGAAVYWRRDRLVFGVFAGALVLPLLAGMRAGWDELPFLCVIFLELSLAGMIAYSLLRWRGLGFSALSALCAGVANACLSPHLLVRFGSTGSRASALVTLVPGSVLTALVIALVALALRAAWRRLPARPARAASGEAASGEERLAVLRMLAEGKVSADEASALLDALGAPATPGDRLPLSGGTLASLVAGVMIAAGFVLPWAPVRIAGMRGYQAGHHVGFLGWLILSLGLLPAVLACIPALDRILRQGMLRLLLACTGLAFAGSLAVRVLAGSSLPGIGLVIVLLAFGVQLASALMDTGILRRPSERASA